MASCGLVNVVWSACAVVMDTKAPIATIRARAECVFGIVVLPMLAPSAAAAAATATPSPAPTSTATATATAATTSAATTTTAASP